MYYNAILKNDIANGDGIRVTLFVSGCSFHCPGCHNPQTHNPCSGKPFTEYEVNKIINALSNKYVSGITLSGGHPLEEYNIEECTKLCKTIKEKLPDKNIWLYSGFCYEQVADYEIFKYVDVLVDGMYNEKLKDRTLKWRGSSNQRVIDINKTRLNKQLTLYCN